MISYMLVFIGGGLGASMRYLMSMIFADHLKYPYGTFIINVIGSFLLGFILMSSLSKTGTGLKLNTFLTIGFTGGFTTFSTFTYEAINLINQGLILQSIFYIFLSIICGMFGIYMGISMAKVI
ncbi:MAG: fluoride efflux transporter CrcB [Candidatus Eremiobacterota bacterium]